MKNLIVGSVIVCCSFRWKLASGMPETSRISFWSIRVISFYASPAGVSTLRFYHQQ
ncbi:hypothetical protein [Salimicrobium flavidum]|uniref:hypothetical protein n=1 Tax=Salimicrobium flavidum TaxID=570947 RepID=UPI001F3AB134|nr:hypothetical protein [Salimicrobium flavidum]